MSAQQVSERGYTIIELVLVIVILGILGVVAAPRFFGTSAYDQRAFTDELSSAMRYAQKIAVASGCPVQVSLTTSTYSLSQQAALAGHCNLSSPDFSSDVLLPSGDRMFGNAPSGVVITPPMVFHYDALGRTDLTLNQMFSIGTGSVIVQAESGLVVVP